MFACFKLVEVEQPLFCGQTVNKIEVGFAVLDAVFPLGMFVFQGKGVIGDAVFLQQNGEDFIRLLCLEDAGVLAQSQSPQGRFDLQLIAGAAKAAVPLRKVAHHATHPALQLAVVPHQQLTGLVQTQHRNRYRAERWPPPV